jgi:hypothetical protein
MFNILILHANENEEITEIKYKKDASYSEKTGKQKNIGRLLLMLRYLI